jgi:hypothetical protein
MIIVWRAGVVLIRRLNPALRLADPVAEYLATNSVDFQPTRRGFVVGSLLRRPSKKRLSILKSDNTLFVTERVLKSTMKNDMA